MSGGERFEATHTPQGLVHGLSRSLWPRGGEGEPLNQLCQHRREMQRGWFKEVLQTHHEKQIRGITLTYNT